MLRCGGLPHDMSYDPEMATLCRLCDTRRPRRFCPAAPGDICAICCGEQREVTLTCPFDCQHLQEARKHDRAPEIDPRTFPHADVRVTDDFLRAHESLVFALSRILYESSISVPDANDYDVREALGALIQTRRTRESGLIYESRPQNPLAASVQREFEEQFARMEREINERSGSAAAIRESDVLGVLVFLERLELQNNNGRRKSRAFLDFLRGWFAAVQQGMSHQSPAGN